MDAKGIKQERMTDCIKGDREIKEDEDRKETAGSSSCLTEGSFRQSERSETRLQGSKVVLETARLSSRDYSAT